MPPCFPGPILEVVQVPVAAVLNVDDAEGVAQSAMGTWGVDKGCWLADGMVTMDLDLQTVPTRGSATGPRGAADPHCHCADVA